MGYLQKHLTDLLRTHECVIIPELGGFVVHAKGARLHEATHRLHPPVGEVSFNARLFRNDGLFAQHLRMKEGVSYEQAMVQINAEVSWIKRQLESGQNVRFDQVGVLHQNRDKQLHFVASGEVNYLMASYGLEPIHLEPVLTLVEEAPLVAPLSVASQGRNRWRNLAAAAAVPLLVVSSWFLHQGIQNDFQLTLVPSILVSSADYAPRYEEEGLRFHAPDNRNFVDQLKADYPDREVVCYSLVDDAVADHGIDVRLKAPAEEPRFEEVATPLQLYFIVGGAFAELRNAENYVVQLRDKGYDASIVDQKGKLHYVAFGSYATRAAALNDLSDIRANDNPGAWLKRR